MGQICRKSDYTDQRKELYAVGEKIPESVFNYTGDILLVGINYSTKTKKHSCVIKNFR